MSDELHDPRPPTPNTVTDAVAFLRDIGYTDDVELDGEGLGCARTQMHYALDNVVVDHTFRFEGDTDPGDEMIVLGLSYPGSDVRATFVSAFGHDADPATSEFLARLKDR